MILLLFVTSAEHRSYLTEKSDTKFDTIPKSLNIPGDNPAPDFSLITLEGDSVKLSDYAGKIVILDFWATWCPPCRKGIPDLISIQNEFENDVTVIGISLDQPSMHDDLSLFIEDYEINYPILLGTLEVVMAYGNVRAIPTSFIIDREGMIVNKYMGLVPKSIYVQEINSLLDNS
jgi:cytochrome c biogenesis protein CcmG/thiol:disulfide interchange protein DsbE